MQGLIQRRPADRLQADVQGGLRLGALAEEVLQAEHAQVEGEDDIYTGPLIFYRIQSQDSSVISQSSAVTGHK